MSAPGRPPPRDQAQVEENLAAASAVVAALRLAEDGPREVVLCPGARSAPLVLALAAADGVRLWPVVDERAAGFFALGLTRASGRAAVLVCTSGSAGLHFAPAVAEAAAAALPLVVITANRPPEQHGCGAAQTMRQADLYGPEVRLAAVLPTPAAGVAPAAFAARVAEAVARAEGPVPGPAHLDLPLREPLWDGERAVVPYAGPLPVRPPAQPAPAWGTVLAPVAAADRVLIVCGPRPAAADGFAAAVQTLAAARGWPLLAEPASQAGCAAAPGPGSSPQLWAADAWLQDPAAVTALAPDWVLRFGAWPTARAVGSALARVGVGRTLYVDPTGRGLDPSHGGAHVVAGSEVDACRALLASSSPSSRAAAWRAGLLAFDRAAATALAASVAATEALTGPAVARAVVAALPPGAALHLGNSLSVRDVATFGGPLPTGTRVFHQRGLSGIEGGIAGLIGEALGHAGPVWGLLGDLAAWHDIGALALAPRLHGRRATLVIVDNGGGGIFDGLMMARHPQFVPLFRTPEPGELGRAIAGFGVPCAGVTSRAALATALAADAGEGLRTIVARVAPGGATHREAQAAVHAALRALAARERG